MGMLAAAAAVARGHTLHAVVGRADIAADGTLPAARLHGADVVIEFTRPDAALANLRQLVSLGIPTVTGTTGWYAELDEIRALVERRRAAVLYAANFSIGVHLFLHAAAETARLLSGRPEFDGIIVEEHHGAKRDAPSGTAALLQARARESDTARAYPITSIRAGDIPGTHALRYEGPDESLALVHTARNRNAFAAGAVAAAEWLPGRSGLFTFEELLFGRGR